jgi:hypothetical protein
LQVRLSRPIPLLETPGRPGETGSRVDYFTVMPLAHQCYRWCGLAFIGLCRLPAINIETIDSELRLVAAIRRAAGERGRPLPLMDVADARLDERRGGVDAALCGRKEIGLVGV